MASLSALTQRMWRRFVAAEDGASLVEYALLMAMIAIVCFTAIGFFGQETNSAFSMNAECMEGSCLTP